MLRKFCVLFFFLCSCLSFADGWQSQSDRLSAIDEEIARLTAQKEQYEVLKQKIQAEQYDSKPKIALVLSGGGAKGAAHIGVLKVLEKYQIPIDMIVGTSVGSIVGAMYAIGYRPEEIETLILGLKFRELLSDSKQKGSKTIENEINSVKYPLKLHMDKEGKLSTPMGVLNGQNIYFQLKNIFARAADIQNFDDLPIAYRAVSTNITQNKEEVIASGDLSLAAFRSMAIPGIISPVPYQKNFYVDGGVVNNFPVDVAIAMGADVIIGVDITANAIRITSDSNALTVINKIASANGEQTTKFHKKLANILITPDVKEHSTVDFSNLDSLIQEGEKAAEAVAQELKYLSDSKSFEEQKQKSLQEKVLHLPKVEIHGNGIVNEKDIEAAKPKERQVHFSQKDLEIWMNNIYAHPYVNRMSYHIEREVLHLYLEEKKEITINTGLSYNSSYGGGLHLAMNMPNFFDKATTYIGTKAEISEYPKLEFSHAFNYYTQHRVFYGLSKIFYHRNPLFLYEENRKISKYASEQFGLSFGLGTELAHGLIAETNFSYYLNHYNYLEGKRDVPAFEQRYSLIKQDFNLGQEKLRDKLFISKGYSWDLHGSLAKSTDKQDIAYQAVDGRMTVLVPIHPKISFYANASTGYMSGENIPSNEHFKIGGNYGFKNNFEFWGLPFSSVLAKRFWTAGLGLQYQIVNNVFLLGKYNYMRYEDLYQQESSVGGYGLGLGLQLAQVPVMLSLAKRRSYASPILEFSVGYSF